MHDAVGWPDWTSLFVDVGFSTSQLALILSPASWLLSVTSSDAFVQWSLGLYGQGLQIDSGKAVFTPVPVRVPVPFRSRSTRSCSVHTCKNWPDPFWLRACDAFTLVPERDRNAYGYTHTHPPPPQHTGLYTVYEIKTITMHLFMITSWNKIGINIGDLFLFLVFHPGGEKWHSTPPPPTRTPFSHEVIKICHFSCLPVLSIWISYYFNFIHIDIL